MPQCPGQVELGQKVGTFHVHGLLHLVLEVILKQQSHYVWGH